MKSRKASETVMPLAAQSSLYFSPVISGTFVEISQVHLPKNAGKPVERENIAWASASVNSMLVRVRQGVADEYFRRAREVLTPHRP